MPIKNSLATLTIKGKAVGFSRPEFEDAIPLQDPEKLIKLAVTTPVTKVRHRVALGGDLGSRCFSRPQRGTRRHRD
ncbi:MAG: hypothetical protein ABGZ37_07200 [Akkermansiaceae bacterium]|nr:hypothetical protein [Roseibacillus sp.]